MSNTLSKSEILEGVTEVLADRLAVERDLIEEQASLIDNLDADSLDFLDILFSLERKFNIKLRDASLDKFLKADFRDTKLTDEGYLAPENIEKLAEFVPALRDPANLPVKPARVFRMLSVESLMILVERKI